MFSVVSLALQKGQSWLQWIVGRSTRIMALEAASRWCGSHVLRGVVRWSNIRRGRRSKGRRSASPCAARYVSLTPRQNCRTAQRAQSVPWEKPWRGRAGRLGSKR